jgi:hypothetical protein
MGVDDNADLSQLLHQMQQASLTAPYPTTYHKLSALQCGGVVVV